MFMYCNGDCQLELEEHVLYFANVTVERGESKRNREDQSLW